MILEKVRQIIADQMCIDVAEVKPDSNILKDIGADSLDVVEMLMLVEKEWGIIVDDDDTRGFSTVQSVADYIEKKTK
ncbi:MAG: acyl carrier protein [Bacteroides sp.]|nr:acyl carrier protein [Bacillota bacterium]MCM1393561.1 acyl carrier protein [[Eubacterium] siraeum]MCM1455020.1 acyl carrier protein [Bacteroides sp.]